MAAKQNYRLMNGGKSQKKGRKNSGGKGKTPSSGSRSSRTGVFFGITLAVFLLLAAAGLFVIKTYRVENITVEGNVHYTREEITEMVLKDRLSYNSLYLSLKYRNKEIRNIPFIETMSIKVLAPDTIKIMVYEKSVAGFVEYMGRYMYFDREGIVVESSETRTQGIPQVTGVDFDHVILYEPLPVEDKSIFREVLSITQMLSKYSISTDKIYFNDANEITLYFEKVRVRLGTGNLEEKIMRLSQILPNLSGESGVLKMENYEEGRKNVTFERDS